MSEKVVLAYSGGLDTSVILTWLIEQRLRCRGVRGRRRPAATTSTRCARRRCKAGARKVYVEDLKEEFVTDYIFPAIKANAIYEGRYLLGTALARPLIAKRQSRDRRA